ncbi:hypothetical protein DFH09DRAFT_1067127 [Mycena vulgaris]|nr:hypothetical protein DFH09DRAFT_1067127 [Mycena vulgaris]
MTFMNTSSAISFLTFSFACMNIKKRRRDELDDDDDEHGRLFKRFKSAPKAGPVRVPNSSFKNAYLLHRRAGRRSSIRTFHPVVDSGSPTTAAYVGIDWDLADTIRGLNIKKTRRDALDDEEDEGGRPQKRLKLSPQPKARPVRVPHSTIMHRRPRHRVVPVVLRTPSNSSVLSSIPAAPISANPTVAPCAIDAVAGSISRGLADITNFGVNRASKETGNSGVFRPIKAKAKHGRYSQHMIVSGRKKWVGNEKTIRLLDTPIRIPTFLLLVSGKYRLVDTPVWTLLKIRLA